MTGGDIWDKDKVRLVVGIDHGRQVGKTSAQLAFLHDDSERVIFRPVKP